MDVATDFTTTIVWYIYIYIYAFSRRFYPKAYSGYTLFCQYVCFLGIEPTTFYVTNAMLDHWATGSFTEVTEVYFSSKKWL